MYVAFQQRRALVHDRAAAARAAAAAAGNQRLAEHARRQECLLVLRAEGAGEACAGVAEQRLGLAVAAQVGQRLAPSGGCEQRGGVAHAEQGCPLLRRCAQELLGGGARRRAASWSDSRPWLAGGGGCSSRAILCFQVPRGKKGAGANSEVEELSWSVNDFRILFFSAKED